MALVQTTPRTASGLFAALALSPGNSPGSPKQLPTLTLFPATPPTADEPLSPLTARQYATHLRESFSKIAHNILPTWDDSPQEPAVRTEDIPVETQSQPVDSTKHRPLASNEARQLSLLLIQHFFPARGNARVMMKESIHLAEMLHEAGVRWDSKRRVMGLHLRGIWEEGQRLTFGSPIGGHGPMDLYVQGSFLSIAETPHPLDPMPIPIELHPASFAALPKLTLQSGLANSLPGVPSQIEHLDPHTSQNRQATQNGIEVDTVSTKDYAVKNNEPAAQPKAFGGDRHAGLGLQVDERHQLGHHRGVRDKWKSRKIAGLKIKVDGHHRLTTKVNAIQYSAALTTPHHPPLRRYSHLARLLPLALRRARRPSTATHRRGQGSDLSALLKSNMSANQKRDDRWAKPTIKQRLRGRGSISGGPKSATSAKRMSFGEWQMR